MTDHYTKWPQVKLMTDDMWSGKEGNIRACLVSGCMHTLFGFLSNTGLSSP